MALLFMDGFDAGDMAAKWMTTNTTTITSGTTTPYGAGRSLELSTGGELIRPITASAQVTLGMHYQPTASACDMEVALLADAGTVEHIRMRRNPSTGRLEASRASTVLATGATASGIVRRVLAAAHESLRRTLRVIAPVGPGRDRDGTRPARSAPRRAWGSTASAVPRVPPARVEAAAMLPRRHATSAWLSLRADRRWRDMTSGTRLARSVVLPCASS